MVGKSLEQLETLRNEDWHEDFIKNSVQEFENINWTTEQCIERINNCKLKKQFGTTKFAEFLEDDDLIIDNELIELKAKLLVESRGFVDVSTYNKLIAYYTDLKAAHNNSGDDTVNKMQYEVQVKNKLRPAIKDLYKAYLEKLLPTGFLENTDCEKATAELFKKLELEIERLKL